MSATSEAAALAALDADALAADVAALVQAPSETGDERPALERLAELALRQGLGPELVEHDLGALRAHPGHPGAEVPRTELLGLTATLPASRDGAPRLCLNGHVDVVGPGEEAWERPPTSGAVQDGLEALARDELGEALERGPLAARLARGLHERRDVGGERVGVERRERGGFGGGGHAAQDASSGRAARPMGGG